MTQPDSNAQSRAIVKRLEAVRARLHSKKDAPPPWMRGLMHDLIDVIEYALCEHEFEAVPNPGPGHPQFVRICRICDQEEWPAE